MRLAQRAHPEAPLVALGHSMGSYALQQLLTTESARVRAAVYSGSSALDHLSGTVDRSQPLSLEAFNQGFEPARTPFDWLSRDPAEVDAYVADPRCGFTVGVELVVEMAAAGARLADPTVLGGTRPDLPLYVLAGDADPANANLSLLHLLVERYQQAGLHDITTRYYPGGRHEMLCETNRDEVTDDLIAWIDQALAADG